jgi:hypothetical protein
MIIEKKLTARMMVMDWDDVEADQAENEDNKLMMSVV